MVVLSREFILLEEYRNKTGKVPYRQVKGNTTFTDYLKGQSESFQQEWLGKRRYELYKSGKLSLDQMIWGSVLLAGKLLKSNIVTFIAAKLPVN